MELTVFSPLFIPLFSTDQSINIQSQSDTSFQNFDDGNCVGMCQNVLFIEAKEGNGESKQNLWSLHQKTVPNTEHCLNE